MNKTMKEMAKTAVCFGIAGIVCIGITAASYKSDIAEKDQQIAYLEQAVENLEAANTVIKAEAEAKQTMIDNLQWELENRPK